MTLSKNTLIINPRTDTTVFGVIPKISHRHYAFPEGNIHLRHGEHLGPSKGWGLNHIWYEHQSELIKMGYETDERVAHYVSDIIQFGANIYCEFSRMGSERVTVLKSPFGVAILEQRYDGDNNDFYSVVTAFNNKLAYGQLIGKVG